jgi:hypothetical protein
VARRGEYPQVPDRIGLEWVLFGEIDLFTGIGRAFGNALALARGLHAHPAGGRGVWVAVARNSRTQSRGQSDSREAFEWTPSMGCVSQGCSRVRREIPPGRTGRIALSQRVLVSIRRLQVSSHGIAPLS